MKSNDIIDALNMLNDDIIEETDKVRAVKIQRKSAWYKPLAVAACFALIAILGIGILMSNHSKELPRLTPMHLSTNAEGFESIMCYNISDIVSNNPWNKELKLTTLPVYKNTFIYDINSNNPLSIQGYEKQIRKLIIDTAKRFKINAEDLIFSDDAPTDEEKKMYEEKFSSSGQAVPDGLFEPNVMIAENDEIRITSNISMTVLVTFKVPVELPRECSLSDYPSCMKTAEYLKREYKDIIAMNEPAINISGGGYNIYAEREPYCISFFEADSDVQGKLINYNFFEIVFIFDDDGNLSGMSFQNRGLSQKVGDYPVITLEKARELLLKGDYISDVPYDFSGEKYISKAELIYQTDFREKFLMPYYKFYVELPSLKQDNGVKTYGIYYVAAVDGEYINK